MEITQGTLTGEQEAFARHRAAVPGSASPLGGTFFYHDSMGVTWRWLVSADGRVLDTTSFANTAARAV